MKDKYQTIFAYGEDEVIINKSRFIGYAKPIRDEEEALAFIEEIKLKHRDATHNVYAYVVGENSNIQRFNDDGEPSGTAGIPALEVIKKEDLRNVVVVVTRYFGGIKLGGGGLIRAYTRGAKIALDAGVIVDMELHKEIRFQVEYDQYGRIENFLMTNNYEAKEIIYEDVVKVSLYVNKTEMKRFKRSLYDLTNGDALIEELGELHLPILNGKRLS